METVDELMVFLTEATADGVRGRLQARGEARAIVREDGVLPDDAPAFGDTIDTDLAEYGFSLLRGSLALREQGGDSEIWRRGFVRAGNAFEALVQNSSPNGVHRGFFRVVGAASYHLASYSARHANAVTFWWIARIALNLIDDLWASSLHRVLP